MGTVESWIAVSGLGSALIAGVLPHIKKFINRKYINILILSNLLLTLLTIIYIIYNTESEQSKVTAIEKAEQVKINTIEKAITSFVKDSIPTLPTLQNKTLSEITEYLRRLNYDETKYPEAIRDLLKKGALKEDPVFLNDPNISSRKIKCFMYQ